MGRCPRKPLRFQVKREVNQANGMARNHQTILVDFAYLPTEPLHEDKITIDNNFIGRSLQSSDAGLDLHNNSSYTLINKLSC